METVAQISVREIYAQPLRRYRRIHSHSVFKNTLNLYKQLPSKT